MLCCSSAATIVLLLSLICLTYSLQWQQCYNNCIHPQHRKQSVSLFGMRNVKMNRHKRNGYGLPHFHHSSKSVSATNDPSISDDNITAADKIKKVPNTTTTVLNEITENNVKEGDLSYAYTVLAILFIAFASNQWSRQAIYYLCDFSDNADPFRHINADIIFSKEMYASLASFGFTVIFAFVSLFAGSVSDQFNRRDVLTISCLAWSIITGLHSQARSFTDLIPLRTLLGVSQAFFNPAAYTLIADIFPPRLVGSINGIFSSGIYLGGGLASLSILLDNQVGWRSTMLSIGVIGIAIAGVLVLVVQDPRYVITGEKEIGNNVEISNININVDDSKKAGSNKSGIDALAIATTAYQSLQEVIAPLEAKLLLSATVIRFFAGFSIAIWKAPFVFAQFPGSENLFAGSNALIVSIGGLSSSLLGGYLSDILANPVKNTEINPSTLSSLSSPSSNRLLRSRSRSWVPAVGSLLSAPLWAGFILAASPQQAAVFLFLEYLGNFSCTIPLYYFFVSFNDDDHHHSIIIVCCITSSYLYFILSR